jgi:hypothetical protein
MTPTPTQQSLKEAIQFNNDGVKFALVGQDAQAISSLSKSLRIFKELLAREDDADDDRILIDMSEQSCTLHSTTDELPQLRDSSFFLFNSLVTLKDRNIESTFISNPEDNHIYIEGVTHAKRADGLRKTESFYNMVTAILANNGDPTIFSQATATLVQMAALNNAAYIRAETGDFQSACDSWRMLSWLVNQARNHRSDIFLMSLNERDLEGMMLNMLMAKRQSVAPAA